MEDMSHRVTVTDIYRQGEDIRSSLSTTAVHIAVLLDRSESRDEQMDKMEIRVSRLERVVYWVGIPLGLIASGTLGYNLFTGAI